MNKQRILKILGWIFLPFVMIYKESIKSNSIVKSIAMAVIVLMWWSSAIANLGNSSTTLKSKIDEKNDTIQELKDELSVANGKIDKIVKDGYPSNDIEETTEEVPEITTPPTAALTLPPTPVPTEAPKEFTFSSGNFVAGKDFTGGTYDIVAVSGGGNVSSDNMYSGGINAIMGVSGDSMYEKEYKNIELPNGTTLNIDRVTIKLIKK